MAVETENQHSSLRFDPESYESARIDGLETYKTLLVALLDSREIQEEEDADSLVRSLPPAEQDLTLRALVRLGGNAMWGVLERFWTEPTLADGTPAAEPLRSWYQRYESDFQRLFPEQRLIEAPPQRDWHDLDGNELWDQLRSAASELAHSREARADSALALFALVRDRAVPLASLFARLELDIDWLVNAAVEGTGGGPIETVREAESSLLILLGGAAEKDAPSQSSETGVLQTSSVPTSAITAFGAFVVAEASDLTREVARRVPREQLVEALREEIDRGPAPSPRRALDIQKRAIADLPVDEDELGVKPLVQGLHALLNDPGTVLPLAIGITAPWGGGKSSVMRQLQKALVEDSGDHGRIWIPVRFDAWKYERSERLWAALAKAIYKQPQERWPWWRRVLFKVRLQRRRQGAWAFWVRGIGVPMALAVATIVVALVTGAHVPATATGGSLVLLALGDTAARIWGIVTDPFKRALDAYTQRPRYEEQLGFTSEADADIANLTAELTRKEGHALVVFVDDLDRCDHRHVVEVVEAINQIFNAAERRQCVFVIGMDRDVVAASIEVAYGETIGRLPEARRPNYGHAFLAKLVQLSVAIPQPDTTSLSRLLAAVTAQPLPLDGNPSEEDVTHFRDLIQAQGPRSPAEVQEAAEALGQSATAGPEARALDEALRLERAEHFRADSEEVRQAERAIVPQLRPNPREVKRFDNAFRLQLHVANGTPGCGLSFELDDLVALGKWVALRLRWPDVADGIDSDPELLERLEEVANGGNTSITGGTFDWFSDRPGLKAFLAEPKEARRMARLTGETFLRVS